MAVARGRPIGSKDRQPRIKRTKLQFCIDQFLGESRDLNKTLHVNFQKPCETCSSCIRVQYKPLPEENIAQTADFMTRALTEHFLSESA
jgi:hypothetical protein